ncbi:MAG: hypothetical protein ACPF8V_04360 [Luteibaculum sp.]
MTSRLKSSARRKSQSLFGSKTKSYTRIKEGGCMLFANYEQSVTHIMRYYQNFK